LLQLFGKRNVLIFDLGGGTFDVSIITIEDGKYEVKATVGDTHLGGEDFDNRMVDHFVHQFKHKNNVDLTINKHAVGKLRTACERAKRMISSSTQVCVEIDGLFEGIDFYTSINRDTFEKLNADLFRSIMKAVEDSLRDAKIDKSQIHDIVLVGGSTRIHKVQNMLKDFFNGKELNKTVNMDEAVAYGAAVQAAILNGEMSVEFLDLVLLDVNPLSLGAETGEGGITVIIKRNTPIPTSHTLTYPTKSENLTDVSFEVCELQPAMTNNKASLGRYKVTAPSGISKIGLTLNIDANGILKVRAVDISARKEKKIIVSSDNGRLSNEQIEHAMTDAKKFSDEDEKQKQRNSAQNALELYCLNMKNLVGGEKLKDIISEDNKNTILDKCNEIIRWLDANQLAEKEEFDYKQKELESICKPIMDNCAGQSLVTAGQGRKGEVNILI
jgi:L1 cell adhesion molecule like protein